MRPFLALALLAVSPALPAQDYDAGARLIRRLEAIKPGGTVVPHWIDGGKSFWYDRGSAHILVDARAGRVETVPIPPGGQQATMTPFLPPHPSGSGEAADVTIRNASDAPVDVYWLDTEGGQRKYATIEPGGAWSQHTYVSHVWLLTDAKGHPLAAYEAPEGGGIAVWEGHSPTPTPTPPPPPEGLSPDGRTVAFVRGDNLWLRRDGTEVQLSTDGTMADGYRRYDLFWSPDGKKLAALRVERGQERHVVLHPAIGPEIDMRYDKPGDRIDHPRLVLFDVASKKETKADERLAPNPFDLREFHWSSDSREFFYLYNQRGHQVLRLLAMDAATARVRTVVEEKSPTFVDYSQKTTLRFLANGREALWASERSGYNHLYRLDLATGRLAPITQGAWVFRSLQDVDEAKREAVIRIMGLDKDQDPYQMHFARVPLDGGPLVRLTQGDGNHTLRWAPDGESYLDTYSRVDLPPVTELHTRDGRRLAVLERGDDGELTKAGWQKPERFVAKGRDGKTDIWGVIYRPSNFDPNRKYPVIENIYAGPHDFFVPKSFSVTTADMRLTELGFVMVHIDGMGTNWRSRAFHDAAYQNLADAGFPDRIRWMKTAAKTHPWMDLDRVGIFGTSAGGQSAASGVLRFGDFYKAAVADCGCHDNRLDKIWWNEAWMGWPVGPAYEANSNANLVVVAKLKRPLFLMVGDADTNVDPISTQVVVDALKAAGKPYELLVVPGAGHGVLGRPEPYRKMQEFFVRELRP